MSKPEKKPKTEPFLMVPKALAARKDLLAIDKLLWAEIRDRIGVNGKCWPGGRKLAADLGVNRDTILASIARLEDLRFNVAIVLFAQLLHALEHLFTLGVFGIHICVQGKAALDLNDVKDVDLAFGLPGHLTGQPERLVIGFIPVYWYEHLLRLHTFPSEAGLLGLSCTVVYTSLPPTLG